jgi:hypothetical protein
MFSETQSYSLENSTSARNLKSLVILTNSKYDKGRKPVTRLFPWSIRRILAVALPFLTIAACLAAKKLTRLPPLPELDVPSDTAHHKENVLPEPELGMSSSTSEFEIFTDPPFEAGIELIDPASLPSPAPPLPSPDPLSEADIEYIIASLPPVPGSPSSDEDAIVVLNKLIERWSEITEAFDKIFGQFLLEPSEISNSSSKRLEELRRLVAEISNSLEKIDDSLKKFPAAREEKNRLLNIMQQYMEEIEKLKQNIDTIFFFKLVQKGSEIIIESKEILDQLPWELSGELSWFKEKSSFLGNHLEEFRRSMAEISNSLKKIDDTLEKISKAKEDLLVAMQQHMDVIEKNKTRIDEKITKLEEFDEKFDIEIGKLFKEKVKSAKERIEEIAVCLEDRLVRLEQIVAERSRQLEDVVGFSDLLKKEVSKEICSIFGDEERYDPEDMDQGFKNPDRIYFNFSKERIRTLVSCLPLGIEMGSEQFVFSLNASDLSRAEEKMREYIDERESKERSCSLASAKRLQGKMNQRNELLRQFIEKQIPNNRSLYERLGVFYSTKGIYKDAYCKAEDFSREFVCAIQNLLQEVLSKMELIIHDAEKRDEYFEKAKKIEGLAIEEIKKIEEFAHERIIRIDNSESELLKSIESQDELARKAIEEHGSSLEEFRTVCSMGTNLNPWLWAVKNFFSSLNEGILTQMMDKSVSDNLELLRKASSFLEIALSGFCGPGIKSDEFSHFLTNYHAGTHALRIFLSIEELGTNPEVVLETLRIFFEVTNKRCQKRDWENGLQTLEFVESNCGLGSEVLLTRLRGFHAFLE